MVILRFHPKEKSFPTAYSDNEKHWHMPIYFHSLVDQGYEIKVYTFYYADNLAIGLGHTLFPYSSLLGYHLKDVEFVAVYQSLENPRDKRAYFSAHSKEGRWYKWEDCEVQDNDLVVYVALNSHACYPYAKRWWRFCGLANDVTSRDGLELKNPHYLSNKFIRKTVPRPLQ